MSATCQRIQLHFLAFNSIRAEPLAKVPNTMNLRACGCHELSDDRLWVCDYHEGFSDGAEMMDGGDT